MLAACGGGAAASITPPPDADASVTAQNNAFDIGSLSLPAEPSKVFFKNLDSQPHNIAIYTDESAGQKLFGGEVITNAATTYEIPALPGGSYLFRCDVHPDMKGSVTIGGA
jgi:plastocyanin